MTSEFVPFGSAEYFYCLAALLFGRGMDLFSTWVLMPTLVGEVNPISKRLGWRGGIVTGVAVSAIAAAWPLLAIILSVVSLLLAARNFHGGLHLVDQPRLFVLCAGGQSAMFLILGGVVMLFTRVESVAFAIGLGMIVFGAVNFFFNMLSLWRNRGG
ncbi:MAG TPA: hypothetical protein VI282_02795 [Verrucomicrobiae bacterium]|jgi:uncharacterized membrane protein YbaN (DUF454 family)